MKVKLIVAVVLTSLSIGERQQRSTVLTDESKRILEHFDFSNFDKQEALNYIDRQRYENQIRGKRSQSRSKKDQNEKAQGVVDTRDELTKDNSRRSSINPSLKFQLVERGNFAGRMDTGWHPGEPASIVQNRLIAMARLKRGHHSRKKHRPKSSLYESEMDFDENKKYDRKEKKRYRKRKRKRKRKRYWDRWTDWTPCSVTCGRGRKIRWRKCIAKSCAFGEFEMGEKTCQLPACNLLSKLLGL